MNTYLDVGVLRIQTYLSRGNRLRARARASGGIAELSEHYSAANHTDRDAALADLLGQHADGWRFNEELGKVDGVVSLVHPGPLPTDVAAVASAALGRLRRDWPGADLHAVWGKGASYLDAYRDHLGPDRARHGGKLSAAPAAELPLARPCGLCEQDAAVKQHRVVDEDYWLCVDCLRRGVQHSGRSAGKRATLLEDVAAEGTPPNHLGTVFLDGNAVGALFDALANAEPRYRHGLSRALSKATRQALAAARAAIQRPDESDAPSIVHVAGGDDLLASVPADRAWAFTRRLLAEFSIQAAAEVGQLLETEQTDPDAVNARLAEVAEGAELPSAAAGLVIHKVKYPFSLVTEAAQERLSAAKRRTRGTAAVAWTDRTVDGDAPPPWRRPWLLGDLESQAERLVALQRAPASARHAAARLIDPDQPVTSWCRLTVHLDRFDASEAGVSTGVQPFLDEAARENDPAPSLHRLLDALTLARWWS